MFQGERFAASLKMRRGGLSLRELANRTGLSAATLSRLERGENPDIETFATLCYWMAISPANFFGEDQPQPQDDLMIVRDAVARLTNAQFAEATTNLILALKG